MEFRQTKNEALFIHKKLPPQYILSNDIRSTRSRTHSAGHFVIDCDKTSNRLNKKADSVKELSVYSKISNVRRSKKISQLQQQTDNNLYKNMRKKSIVGSDKSNKKDWHYACQTVLAELLDKDISAPFQFPVDSLYEILPNYFDIIKNPMDLSCVKKKLKNGKYTSALHFLKDVRRTFNNAMTYNEEESQVYAYAKELIQFFDNTWARVSNKAGLNINTDNIDLMANTPKLSLNEKDADSKNIDSFQKENNALPFRRSTKKTDDANSVSVSMSDNLDVDNLDKKENSIKKRASKPTLENKNNKQPIQDKRQYFENAKKNNLIKQRGRPSAQVVNTKPNIKENTNLATKKFELTQMFRELKSSDLGSLWQILAESDPEMSRKNEIELDLDKLPESLLDKQYNYTKEKIESYQKKVQKTFDNINSMTENPEKVPIIGPQSKSIYPENIIAQNNKEFSVNPNSKANVENKESFKADIQQTSASNINNRTYVEATAQRIDDTNLPINPNQTSNTTLDNNMAQKNNQSYNNADNNKMSLETLNNQSDSNLNQSAQEKLKSSNDCDEMLGKRGLENTEINTTDSQKVQKLIHNQQNELIDRSQLTIPVQNNEILGENASKLSHSSKSSFQTNSDDY